MQNVRKLVESVFSNSGLKAIGAFLFLRFLCPALIAPEGFELIQGKGHPCLFWFLKIFFLLLGTPSPETRRALCLIAKVLQNLANVHEFKEPYMLEFNSFIQTNSSRLNEFYDKFTVFTLFFF